MKTFLITLSILMISTTVGNFSNLINTNTNNKQILQKNVDDFQKLSNNIYLTATKIKHSQNGEVYLWNISNHQKTDLNFKVLSISMWTIGNNKFIASDGNGNSYVYDVSNPKKIIKIPINFLKGDAIVYAQKITNNIYLVSFPDKNLNCASAVVDFSNINNLKYTILPNNPFITNGDPAYIINNTGFIVSVTKTNDWVYYDISDFNHPVYYSLFNDPHIVLSSINVLANNQVLVTIWKTDSNQYITQLWTINNSNPNLWIKQNINNIVIKDFIIIGSNLAIASNQHKLGLFLLNYSNWNSLIKTPIANSQNIEMLDNITLYPFVDLIFFKKQIIFNDFNNKQIKLLNFSDLNNIIIKSLNISLYKRFAGFYQISKVKNQQFLIVDKKQNFDLLKLN